MRLANGKSLANVLILRLMAIRLQKTELFVATLGWVTIVISALAFYLCLVNLLSLYFDLNLQIKGIVESAFLDSNLQHFESTRIIANAFGFLTFYLAAFLVAGVSVLERRNWGRILFILLSAILVFLVLAAVIAYLVFGYRQEFVDGMGSLSFSQKFRFVTLGVPSVMLAWSLYRISLRLSLERVIRWFE